MQIFIEHAHLDKQQLAMDNDVSHTGRAPGFLTNGDPPALAFVPKLSAKAKNRVRSYWNLDRHGFFDVDWRVPSEMVRRVESDVFP
jgi:hypothetical protein